MAKRSSLLYLLILLGLLTVLCDLRPARAASAKSKYFTADRCYQQLRHNPARQKYRDAWLGCIEKYMDVYRQDPGGPWAAAGLYQAGQLYIELFRRSYLQADREEAIQRFAQLSQRYPKSRYAPKAQAARQALNSSGREKDDNPPLSPAHKMYKAAQTQYQRLQKEPGLRKYRHNWLKCIEQYRSAFQKDPQGPLAAAALYGLARSYSDLHRYSGLEVDQIQARNTFQDLIRQFPQSTYADKARRTLGDKAPAINASDSDHTDAISQVIQGAREKPGPAAESEAGSREPVPNVTSQTPAVIEGLRFWSNPRYTRVVIDANGDTVFTYNELREDPSIGKPQRIYIDVHNSRLSGSLQKVVPINDNLLSDARAGQYTPDTVRVVVDIKSSKTYKIFSLKNPFRIVLDVWGVDTQAKTAAQKPPVRPGNHKLPTSALAKQLALGVRRIVIDPGHGGRDYGAPGYLKGVHEKHVALKLGRQLAEMIRDQLNCETILTRDKDVYLSLEERTAIANTQDADLFISIHTNASPDNRASGIETFMLNLATDDEAIRVAALENATSTKNISDLDSILQDLMQNAKVSESSRLASYVQQAVLAQVKKKYRRIKSKGVKQAPFYVLLGAEMPSILVETAFISNPTECKRLTTPAYRKAICQGIVAGVKRYIEETKPLALNAGR